MNAILQELRENPELKQQISQYKVLLKDPTTNEFPAKTDREGKEFPRIVLYVESKESAQKVFDAMIKLFPNDSETSELAYEATPRLNRPFSKPALVGKIDFFEQIFWQILRAYVYIWSKI